MYQVTLETKTGFLCERGDFAKKSVALSVARAMASGTNLPDALRYIVEQDGKTIETFSVTLDNLKTD